MREEKERHLNMVLQEVYPNIQQMLDEGVILPSMICGLVHVAKKVAEDNREIVRDDFFEACLRDILDGGEGLHVGKKYSE